MSIDEPSNTTFVCLAVNDHGENERIFEVSIGKIPEAPIDISVAGNTSEILELNVTMPEIEENNGHTEFLVIEYKKFNEEAWSAEEYKRDEINGTGNINY